MNLIELDRALKQLRLRNGRRAGDPSAPGPGRTARPHRSALVPGLHELALRGERLLERRKKQAQFRTPRRPSTTSTSLSTRR